MRKPPQTHLKPRYGTSWEPGDDPREYILRVRNNDTRGDPDATFTLAARFDPPIARADISVLHAAGQLVTSVDVGAQKSRYLSVYAHPPDGAHGTAQLIVTVSRAGEADVIEQGHNAVLRIGE